MPRIRTLKPQFWDSPDTAKADLAPRLLFMAMWNWADDAGRGTANLKELEAFAFPYDDVTQLPRRSSGNSAPVWRNFAELFWETVQVYKVSIYVHGGRKYYEISSFRVHQSKNFRPDSSLPGPDDGEKWDIASEYGLSELGKPSPLTGRPLQSSGNSALSCRNPPLDRDEDRDRDKEPPYPPRDEPPTPQSPAKRTNNGAELARTRFSNLPARSPAAHQIAQAFSASLPVPVESGLQAEIATQIDKCLRDSIPPPAIADGLRAWAASDSWHPSQIPKFVMKAAAATARRTNGVGKPTQKAMGYDQLAEELIAEISREEP